MIDENEGERRFFFCKSKKIQNNKLNTEVPKKKETLLQFYFSSMPSISCFHENKDCIAVCGEDGEIHLLKVDKGELRKIGFVYVFEEIFIAAEWAPIRAGGRLAVAGSRGSLVVFSVDTRTGTFLEEQRISLKDPCYDLKWAPMSPRLVFGGFRGTVSLLSLCSSGWNLIETHPQSQLPESETSVTWDPQGKYIAASNSSEVYLFQIIPDYEGREQYLANLSISPIESLYDERITRILWSNSSETTVNSSFIILTNEKIHFYRVQKGIAQDLSRGDIHRKKRMQKYLREELKEKYHDEMREMEKNIIFQQKQEICAESIDRIYWGKNNREIGCYSTKEAEKNRKQRDLKYRPMLLKQMLNGKWKKVEE